MSSNRQQTSARRSRQSHSEDIARSLGRIEGQLCALVEQNQNTAERLGKIDERLRKVEVRSAVHGAGAGFLVSTGVSAIAFWLRSKTGV